MEMSVRALGASFGNAAFSGMANLILPKLGACESSTNDCSRTLPIIPQHILELLRTHTTSYQLASAFENSLSINMSTAFPLLSLPDAILKNVLSMASHGYPRSTSEKTALLHHRTHTINTMGANRRLRRLAVQAWFDTQWYELEIEIDFSRDGKKPQVWYRGDFVQTVLFGEQGRCLRVNVRILDTAMMGPEIAEVVEEFLGECGRLREVEVDMWVSRWCDRRLPRDGGVQVGWAREMKKMLVRVQQEKERSGEVFRGVRRLRT